MHDETIFLKFLKVKSLNFLHNLFNNNYMMFIIHKFIYEKNSSLLKIFNYFSFHLNHVYLLKNLFHNQHYYLKFLINFYNQGNNINHLNFTLIHQNTNISPILYFHQILLFYKIINYIFMICYFILPFYFIFLIKNVVLYLFLF